MKLKTAFLVLAALGVLGCGGNGNSLINVPNPRVRFANLMPGIASAKAKVGSDTISSDIPFGTVSDYAITPNGTKDLTVGDSTFNNLSSLTNQLFETNKHYTGVGFGTATRGILLLEENESAASANTVAIRIAHASEGFSAMDVYITDAAAGNSLPASPSFASVATGTTTTYTNLAVGLGTTQVRIRVYAAGQTSTPVLDTNIPFDERQRATIAVYQNVAVLAALKLREDI